MAEVALGITWLALDKLVDALLGKLDDAGSMEEWTDGLKDTAKTLHDHLQQIQRRVQSGGLKLGECEPSLERARRAVEKATLVVDKYGARTGLKWTVQKFVRSAKVRWRSRSVAGRLQGGRRGGGGGDSLIGVSFFF